MGPWGPGSPWGHKKKRIEYKGRPEKGVVSAAVGEAEGGRSVTWAGHPTHIIGKGSSNLGPGVSLLSWGSWFSWRTLGRKGGFVKLEGITVWRCP